MKQRIAALIFLLLLVLWGLSGLYTVKLTENGVVRRFGRIVRITTPGWHYRLPWPVERVVKVEKTTTVSMSIGYRVSQEAQGIPPLPEETEWLLGDLNIMNIRMGVNYYVDDPALSVVFMNQDQDYLTPGFLIRSLGESILTDSLGRIRYEDLLARRTLFEQEVLEQIQKGLDDYRSGIVVQNVSLDVNPPSGAVARAFQEAKSAQAERERWREEAESDANAHIQEASAKAYKLVSEASAEYNNIVQEAHGQTAAFLQLAEEYERSPRETMERLYWETVTRIRDRTKKIVIDGRENAPPVRIYK